MVTRQSLIADDRTNAFYYVTIGVLFKRFPFLSLPELCLLIPRQNPTHIAFCFCENIIKYNYFNLIIMDMVEWNKTSVAFITAGVDGSSDMTNFDEIL